MTPATITTSYREIGAFGYQKWRKHMASTTAPVDKRRLALLERVDIDKWFAMQRAGTLASFIDASYRL